MMNYLVGENVFTFNSGTEFSQFERLSAFNKHGMHTVLLTRNYNRFASRDMKTHNVDPKSVLNMYDYFQNSVDAPMEKQHLRYLATMPLDYYHIVGVNNNYTNINLDGKTKGVINVMPETVGLVGDIEYKDSLGQLAVREYWDWRGFCSMVETYHPSGEVAHQQYLNMEGKPVIEVAFMYIDEKVSPTMWKLLNYGGKDYQFDTEDQLFNFFLNEVNMHEQGIFISDRRSLDRVVLGVKNAGARYAYLHSSAFANSKHPKGSSILPEYNVALGLDSNIDDKFDAVICPTQDQIDDLIERNKCTNMLVEPDSYVMKDHSSRDLTRDKNLVYVGRLAEEKNILDLIECFNFLNKKRDDVHLTLQGYFSSEAYQNKVKALLSKLDLEDKVTLAAYNPNLDVIYDKATIFVNTSDSEGFGMNMLESMSYGVPVVSFANIYSKHNLIENDLNGFTIKNRSSLILANKIEEILSDSDNYHSLSEGALRTAKLFSEVEFINKWKQII